MFKFGDRVIVIAENFVITKKGSIGTVFEIFNNNVVINFDKLGRFPLNPAAIELYTPPRKSFLARKAINDPDKV